MVGVATMRSVDPVPRLGAVAWRVILHRMVDVIVRGARHVPRVAVHASSRCLRHALGKEKVSCDARRRRATVIERTRVHTSV